MPQERTTAGLLPKPVWLIVHPDEEDDHRRAIGPIHTLERLKGVADGICWASPGDEIDGVTTEVPGDCEEISIDSFDFKELEAQILKR